MVSSYLLSIETPTPLSLGVGVRGYIVLVPCCVLCFGSLAQGELWKCSFCVGHLLALQALFLLRLRLPFSRKLLWEFRFLGLLLLLLPSL